MTAKFELVFSPISVHHDCSVKDTVVRVRLRVRVRLEMGGELSYNHTRFRVSGWISSSSHARLRVRLRLRLIIRLYDGLCD